MVGAACPLCVTIWRFPRSIAPVLGPALIFGLFMAARIPALAQGLEQAGPSAERVSFAIPPAPLADALIAFAGATGMEVFADHALVVGRRSAEVKGSFGPEEALRRLLDGTGLDIRVAASRGYTLVAPWSTMPEPPPDRMPDWSADTRHARFFADLQIALKRALCSRSATAPGAYRAALALWFNPAGEVAEARVLGTTADPAALRDVLQNISLREPVPASLEQPVTLVILPRPSDQTGDCRTRDVARR